jgi:sugar phosphate isomerase/epimerase
LRSEIRAAASAANVRIPSVGFGVLNQGGLAGTPDQIPRAVATLRAAIEIAVDLGATVVMLQHLGANAISGPEKVAQVVDGLRALVPDAEARGITLALEDLLDAHANLAIINEVGSPALKVYYDVCNTWGSGHDVPADIVRLGKHIAQVHFKDRDASGNPCHLGRGIVDVGACAEALREIGYDGWLLLETPAEDDPIGNGRRNLEYLRRFV